MPTTASSSAVSFGTTHSATRCQKLNPRLPLSFSLTLPILATTAAAQPSAEIRTIPGGPKPYNPGHPQKHQRRAHCHHRATASPAPPAENTPYRPIFISAAHYETHCDYDLAARRRPLRLRIGPPTPSLAPAATPLSSPA
jgi:hypothetical protein